MDDAGNAYVAGYTESDDFSSPGAYQETYGGDTDVFAAKIDATGSTRVYCTYLGGSKTEYWPGIAVDGSGHAYVTGRTYSSNFPINYYLPKVGVTTKLSMGIWKAIVIIYAKENPDKKWLRFYWWRRDLQTFMMSKYQMGAAQGLKWETRKGVLSPNIYEKETIRPLIDGIKKMKDLWAESRPKVDEDADFLKKFSKKGKKKKAAKKKTKKKSTKKKTTKKKSTKKKTTKKKATKKKSA